jgi:hypothetical protein
MGFRGKEKTSTRSPQQRTVKVAIEAGLKKVKVYVIQETDVSLPSDLYTMVELK